MTALVVVAAGSGQRLGSAQPKALVPLAGRPLVAHAVAALAAAVDDVVVVAPAGAEAEVARAVAGAVLAAGGRSPVVVAGGVTRARSVGRGLAALPRSADVVAVHDAARPLVDAGVLARCREAVRAGADAAAPGVLLSDTVKEVGADGVVLRTPERASLRAVQTPQVVRRDVLERAHLAARAEGRLDDATDDLALVEAVGGRVRLVEGSPSNLKVTWPRDLVVAEALLAAALRTAGPRGPHGA